MTRTYPGSLQPLTFLKEHWRVVWCEICVCVVGMTTALSTGACLAAPLGNRLSHPQASGIQFHPAEHDQPRHRPGGTVDVRAGYTDRRAAAGASRSVAPLSGNFGRPGQQHPLFHVSPSPPVRRKDPDHPGRPVAVRNSTSARCTTHVSFAKRSSTRTLL